MPPHPTSSHPNPLLQEGFELILRGRVGDEGGGGGGGGGDGGGGESGGAGGEDGGGKSV